jgi:biotin operon repressor
MTQSRDQILDRLFRTGSSARHVADLILDGRPHSRQELADAANVSPTTIPRVVRMLEHDGIHVEKGVGDDGRTVTYRTHHDQDQTRPTRRTTTTHDGHPTTSTIPPTSVTIAGDTITINTTAGDYQIQIQTDGTMRLATRDREIIIT